MSSPRALVNAARLHNKTVRILIISAGPSPLLAQQQGFRCTLIVRGFGAISIDHRLAVGVDEEILESNHGGGGGRLRGEIIRRLDCFRKGFERCLADA